MKPSLIAIVILVAVGILLTGCRTAAHKESHTYKAPVFSEDEETNFDGKSSIYDLESGVQHSNPVAEVILGYCMVHGIHVAQDIGQGVRLIRSSAEQGCVHGMADWGNLGLTRFDGHLVAGAGMVMV